MPYTIDDILNEVNSYDWQQWKDVNGTRFKQALPDQLGPIVNNLRNFFVSDEFQEQLLSLMSQRPEFYGSYWRDNQTLFKNKLGPIFECDMDTPGFTMQPHLDDRGLVIVGMCHFIKDDDPKQSTTFYTSESASDPLRMPTGNGIGWVTANLHNSWHSGHNISDQNRFSIKFGVRINFKS
jgi:hypothetical protein